MDTMFNTDVIVKDMKGGKEDMTENKRFRLMAGMNINYDILDDGEAIGSLANICDLLNELSDENEQLRKENDMFSCELSVSANKEISRNCRIAELEEENEHYKSLFFELVETALTDKNCRELYCKGILDIFNKANSLNQAREMIKEHLE